MLGWIISKTRFSSVPYLWTMSLFMSLFIKRASILPHSSNQTEKNNNNRLILIHSAQQNNVTTGRGKSSCGKRTIPSSCIYTRLKISTHACCGLLTASVWYHSPLYCTQCRCLQNAWFFIALLKTLIHWLKVVGFNASFTTTGDGYGWKLVKSA